MINLILSFASSLILSDVHVDPDYNSLKERNKDMEGTNFFCRDYQPWAMSQTEIDQAPLPSFPFGQYGCDLPPLAYQAIMQDIDYKQVDSQFLMGDIMGHKLKTQKSFNESVFKFSQFLNKALKSFYTVGNNDLWPDNSLGPTFSNESELVNPVLKITQELLENNQILKLSGEQKSTFLRGGFYSDSNGQYDVISLNTVMYTYSFVKNNNYSTTVEDPRGQLQFLRENVQRLKNVNRKYVIMMHVCPGVNAYDVNGNLQFIEPWHSSLLKILAEYQPNFVLCGHSHKDQFKVLNGTVVFNIPGLSPNSYNNPAIRYVNITAEGQMTDYVQYYASIQNANYVKKMVLRRNYQFSEQYGGAPTAQRILELITIMREDPRKFAKFMEAEDVFYQDKRHDYLCASETVGAEAFKDCQDTWGGNTVRHDKTK